MLCFSSETDGGYDTEDHCKQKRCLMGMLPSFSCTARLAFGERMIDTSL